MALWLSLVPVGNAQTSPSNTNAPTAPGTGSNNNAGATSTPPAGVAQTNVTAVPPSLIVAGSTGEEQKRNLLLQTSEPVEIKQIITSDLTRADGVAVLPADKIEVTPLDRAATAFHRLAVTLNLKDAPHGEFSGDVKVVHSKGVQSVPVLARVKHGWLLPLLALLAGIILGTWLTAYRTKGKMRDEVLVRLGSLRAQMRTDAELSTALSRPFREQINNYLTDVQLALDGAKWDDARASMEKAEKVFNVWSKYRQQWTELLGYHAVLAGRLLELKKLKAGALSAHLLKIERALDDAVQESAGADSPKVLRDKLDAIWQQINGYVKLQSRINEIKRIAVQLPATTPPDVVKLWEAKSQALEQRLDNILPSDTDYQTAYEQLRIDIEQGINEVSNLIPHSFGVVSLEGGMGGVLPSPPPSFRAAEDERQASFAASRLRIFALTGYVAALVLLAGVGFGELYVARATFGAWNDYFALLAWGFGAEATRASVVQTARNLGLPSL